MSGVNRLDWRSLVHAHLAACSVRGAAVPSGVDGGLLEAQAAVVEARERLYPRCGLWPGDEVDCGGATLSVSERVDP